MTAQVATMPATTKPKSLVQKLAEVMAAVGRIPKRGKNSFHGYDYVKEDDIVEVVRKELSDRNIMLLPGISGHEWRDLPPTIKDGKEKPRDPVVLLTMTFTFMDGDSGETIEREWLGAGQDGGDKGTYKAMTGGDKYFLLKTFLIPTGDDPERETREERGEARSRDKATARPDKPTKDARKARGPLPPGAVYIEKVVPKSDGGSREWAEVITSTGEQLIAREPGCIGLATQLAQEAAPVVIVTSRNGKGNLELDEIVRWKPETDVVSGRQQPTGKAEVL